MRAVIQRVKRCSVIIDGIPYSTIGQGILILLAIKQGDSEKDAEYVAQKCASLRIFDDSEGKMNLSLLQIGASAMIVSQFTLYGETRRGNRPSYSMAAQPEFAEPLYKNFVQRMEEILGKERVATGVFRAMMEIELVNAGPVTLIVESKEQ